MSSFAALRMTSRLGDSHTEKKTARTPREGNAGRPTYWLPGVGEFASPFFFRRPSPIVIGGLASEAPASIPRWLAAFWFTSTSAASRLNRGSASYSARRRATATWTKRAIGLVFSKLENDQFSAWRRQYMERLTDAQEAIFLSPAINISKHFHTRKF